VEYGVSSMTDFARRIAVDGVDRVVDGQNPQIRRFHKTIGGVPKSPNRQRETDYEDFLPQ